MKKMVLAGGSGFLGGLLSQYFAARDYEIVILSRRESQHSGDLIRSSVWDGRSIGPWARELEGADVLINLAGRSVDCRYTEANRRVMMDSRLDSTRVLGEAVQACAAPPRIWLQSSTATIYEHNYGPPHGESGPIAPHPEAKDAFSIELATAWEDAFNRLELKDTRRVLLRMAMVFDLRGSAYRVLARLAKFGLGGTMGHGRQYVSWIQSEDFCSAVEWIIEREECTGVYNLASPNPLSNKEMMRQIRDSLSVPFGLPASRQMLEIGAFFLRTETELIVKSRCVVPERLLAEGFTFRYPDFSSAVNNF